MTFLFFSAADAPLFSRDDAESAEWTHEELTLTLEFPYDAEKPIQRGQRVGFTDALGVFQAFEVRKAETMEPDHYQRATCEHIAVAELTDEHAESAEFTNVTASAALTALLTGTLWSVGTVTASNTSSADIGMGSVWQGVRSIESSWNVYITPRVTVGASGITGRYLDIAPAGGVWRGVRLAVDKNADEIGVIWDDTQTLTALYGYGALVNGSPLTFANEVWTATDDHPAKPSGQKYIEDPAATAAYGRNGRPRYGYYQNSGISDAGVLLQKTWETLKTTNAPQVSIDSMVRDLYRLGYADQPLRLHDTAIVDIRPTGTSLQREIIRLTENLLDPTATRVTIGAYIPNIVYINRETARGGSGGRVGVGNRRGQSASEATIQEFETEIMANAYQISLRAYQRDMDNVDEILRQAGLSINAQGVLVYADDNVNMWLSRLNVQADRIGLVVQGSGANASIKAAEIVTSINNSGSTVIISADHIDLDGYVTAGQLSATNAAITNLTTGQTTATSIKSVALGCYNLTDVNGQGLNILSWPVSWKSKTVLTGVSVSFPTIGMSMAHDFYWDGGSTNGRIIMSYADGSVTPSTSTIYYLGANSAPS